MTLCEGSVSGNGGSRLKFALLRVNIDFLAAEGKRVAAILLNMPHPENVYIEMQAGVQILCCQDQMIQCFQLHQVTAFCRRLHSPAPMAVANVALSGMM